MPLFFVIWLSLCACLYMTAFYWKNRQTINIKSKLYNLIIN